MGDLPNFEELMFPLLEYAKDGKIHSINDAEKHLAKKLNLTVEQQNRKKQSGYETFFLGRLRWARLYLRKAGLINDAKKKAHYKITESGKKFLKGRKKTLNSKILMDYPDFKKWQDKISLDKKTSKEKTSKGRGIVVLLDFLGTKGMWKEDKSEKVIEKWITFIQSFENVITTKLKPFGKTSFDAFSDTIIITVITKRIESALCKISNILSSFIIESMIIQRPLRGCISVGEIIKGKFLVLGNAIDEAEEYYELPQWVGISAAPSAHSEIEEMHERHSKNSYVFRKVSIPLRSSLEQNAWAVNWADFVDPQKIQQLSKHWRETFETMDDVFYANMKNLSTLGSALKWRNTLKFFEETNGTS